MNTTVESPWLQAAKKAGEAHGISNADVHVVFADAVDLNNYSEKDAALLVAETFGFAAEEIEMIGRAILEAIS